jgi:hypothetical protein
MDPELRKGPTTQQTLTMKRQYLSVIGSETHSRRPLARGVLRPGDEVLHVHEQLGLAGARVSTEEDVQLGNCPRPVLLLERNFLIDILVFVNAWGKLL